MARRFQLTWILPIILGCTSFGLANLDSVYEWKYIDYSWQSDEHKAYVAQSNRYNYANIIPNDVQLLPDGRYLITTPKITADNPASLSIISDKTGDGGNLLTPYPDWSWHKPSDCNGIISVNRVIVDECNRLWLVDSGKINGERICSAKIMSFDLETNELLQSFIIPTHLTYNSNDQSKGLLEIQAVETSSDNCNKVYVYIADIQGHALIIWDRLNIWRLEDKDFSPANWPNREITIDGDTITLSTGPVGFYLTPSGVLDDNYLMFFESVPLLREYAASATDFHNSKDSGDNINYYMSGSDPSEEYLASAVSKDGIVVKAYLEETAIVCRNLKTGSSVVTLAQDTTILQFVTSVKITKDPSGSERIIGLSNRMQKAIQGTMIFTETNFRVFGDDFNTLTENTDCRAESKSPAIITEIGFDSI